MQLHNINPYSLLTYTRKTCKNILGQVKLLIVVRPSKNVLREAIIIYYLAKLTFLQVQISRVGACYYFLLIKKHIYV